MLLKWGIRNWQWNKSLKGEESSHEAQHRPLLSREMCARACVIRNCQAAGMGRGILGVGKVRKAHIECQGGAHGHHCEREALRGILPLEPCEAGRMHNRGCRAQNKPQREEVCSACC